MLWFNGRPVEMFSSLKNQPGDSDSDVSDSTVVVGPFQFKQNFITLDHSAT